MSPAGTFSERLVDAGRGLLTGATSASVGVARSVGVVLRSMGGGVAQCARGRPREGLPRLGQGLTRVAQLPADAVLMMGGRVLSSVQVLVGLEPPGRRLTEDEVSRLRPIFGDSLDFAAVRVKVGRLGLLGLPGRAFAHGNTVFVPPQSGAVDFGLLVHELTHVWQHQHGGTAYLSAALAAQWSGDGYDWRKGVSREKRWAQLNPEQQAQLIEDAAVAGLIPFTSPVSPRMKLRGWSDAALALLDEAVTCLHAGRGAP
ncbi:DUF4157 domain-containing protein [Corallococcus macrosporus]|uniref:eCIS core domain-containing protein n=1 Tax=Myxococcus fulvus (strain ATCC BAA-855 / HW-1) TaxID=483219 RepID=F8C8U1_MYXFH|nr:DUF4157 domain-containing protein [Corallococcus macrosporus]AEI63238.1 hypothetical protein LILAB_06605 [Corallococcus macrosporus]